MIRRLFKASPRPAAPRRRRPARRRPLALQTLEQRQLLALLTNGAGDGQVRVEVNEMGAFGNSPDLAVSLPTRPQGNEVSDAVFNPVGARPALGTTYESGLAIALIAPGATREFLTAGTIGGTGNNTSGFFLGAGAGVPQNNLERHSRFFYPNNVQRPTNDNDIPANAQLVFDLRQTLVDLEFMGSQDGTALVQEYTITNVSGGPLSFELIRYWDGDLFATGAPLLDEGGERVFDVRRGVNSVFQSDVADNCAFNDPTFHEIRSSSENVPRTGRWEVGLAGNMLPTKPAGPLLTNIIAGAALADDVTPAADDPDNNDIRNTDADVAVALRQEFLNIENNRSVLFVSTTVFGHPPQGSCVVVPPPLLGGQAEGVKYIDRDGNGVRDPGEPGVPGFTIFADLNQNGVRDPNEPASVTDQNGQYVLGVPVGMTEIREVQQPGWTQTGPIMGFQIANVMAAGEVVTDLDFGNVPDPAEIRGVKFDDDNRNGVQDPDEPGMENVTIFLDLDDDAVLDVNEPFVVTDAQGAYAFTDLEPGVHVVREIVPEGFEQTTPGGDGAHRVRVSPGQVVAGVDFGNRLLRGSITGVKWNDLNGDGVRGPDEPPVPGAVIYVDLNRDGRLNLGEPAAVTNTFGEYEIGDLLPGEYVVREVVPTGVTVTFPPEGFHRKVVFAGLPTPFVDFGNRTNFDFGDAPASYGVLLVDNGARHAIVPGFRLGQRIDGEPDGQPSPDARGDDTNGGGFAAPVHFAVGDQPTDVILADVAGGDGVPDLVTANRLSNDVSVARGNGDGTFGPAVEVAVQANPSAVVAGDFNGDGRLDLAVAHEGDNDVTLLINNGGGGFQAPLNFAAGGAQSDIAAFDFDGDNDLDIIVTRPGSNDVAVLRNLGGAPLDFEPPSTAAPNVTIFPVGQNPVALELGRINSDALLDVVVVNRGSNSVSVLRNLGGGALATAVNYTVGAGPNDVAIADLDADGDRDLAVANDISGDVTVLYNNGLGVFPNQTRMTFDAPGNPVSIVAGMFDARPGVDLAAALQGASAVAILSNDGSGRFPAASTFPTGGAPAAIVAANLDGDNIVDLITANFGADTASVLTFEGGDEDGVRFAGPLAPGRVTGVTINASAPGVINAWIDFDRNGVFDAANQVLKDAAVAAGNNAFFISAPEGLADGPVFARFRLSEQRGLAPTGPAFSGEVEDYQVMVLADGGVPSTGHTNLANPEDVDGNNRVELFDVLLLVNDLRAGGVRALPPVEVEPPPPFRDVNGNGLIDLNDVLRVINRILMQRPPVGAPEGEGEPDLDLALDEPTDEFDSALDQIALDVCQANNLR